MNVNINALDEMDSLLWASNSSTSRGFSYSPFGSTVARNDGDGLLPGFNGERPDPVSQSYNLGNGYRTYNPTLMRFNAPDSWSPFGAAGLNQYAYCDGDPINRSDPSGHMSWQAGVGIGLGILGILGSIFTFGQSIAAATAAEAALTASMAADLIATGLGVAASVTGVASAATQESDPEASRVLGWVSFGLGIASFATHTANSIESKFKGRSGSFDISHGGGGGNDASTRARGAMILDGNMNNMTWLGKGVSVFEDVESGKPTINIVGHGTAIGKGASLMKIDGKEIGPVKLKALIQEHGYDFNNFSKINLFSCNSANAGEYSFGQRLSTITGKQVKAFEGCCAASVKPEVIDEWASKIPVKDRKSVFSNIPFFIHEENPFDEKLEYSDWCRFSFKPKIFNPLSQ